MRRFIWSDLDKSSKEAALLRPQAISNDALMQDVRDILSDVRDNSDEALLRLTEKFDGVRPTALEVPASELEAAWNALPATDKSVCLLYTSPSPRDLSTSRMPSSA